MKNNKSLRFFIVILILLFFSLFCFLLYFYIKINLDENGKSKIAVTTANNENLETIEEVLAKYDCKFWKQDHNHIYVSFSKDLFEENGKSNEAYFKSIINGLERFFPNSDFYLEEYDRNIEIYAKYDNKKEKHILIINSLEDYYNEVEGKDYIGIDNVKYPEESKTIKSVDPLLKELKNNGMKFSSIKDILGEGTELENGYFSYLNGTIKLRIVNNSIVRNIVYSRNYKEKIFKNFDNNATIEEIYYENPNNCYGGVNQGYLGYRTNQLYYFIYDDEISVYGYSYKKNDLFEDTLKRYIKDNDFDKFVKLITGQLPTYDYFEYNEKEKTANIMFSSYGIEVNMKNNSSKEIILYNNYCFTDYTKDLVKYGLITFKNDENSIEKMEIQRRNNKGS